MADHVRVNRSLADKHFDHIDHALGRPLHPLGETYRNHFAVDAESKAARAFDASPHWRKGSEVDGMAFYHVTREGRHALADHLKATADPWRAFAVSIDGFTRIVAARSRGHARYRRYLEVSDCWPDIRFGDFVRRATVRRVEVRP